MKIGNQNWFVRLVGITFPYIISGSLMAQPLVYNKVENTYTDIFDSQGLENWVPEIAQEGEVLVKNGKLDIDVSAGATLWYQNMLTGNVLIEYDIVVVDEGGTNDRVSDMNCFWMASDLRYPADIFKYSRNGDFEEYHKLRLYYVGLGGHDNTRTRFRRYQGEGKRAVLPEHDLTDQKFLITPNRTYKIQLIVLDNRVQYIRDGEIIFDYFDPSPLSTGWFGFRTFINHMRVDDFRVYRIETKK